MQLVQYVFEMRLVFSVVVVRFSLFSVSFFGWCNMAVHLVGSSDVVNRICGSND